MLKWLVAISAFLSVSTQCFGQTAWIKQQSGLTSELRAVAFFDSLTGFAAGDSCVKTTDGGKHWTLVPEIKSCTDIKIDKNGTIWFAECVDLAYSNDSGRTFVKHNSPCVYGIAMHDSMITGCGIEFNVYNTFDSGKTWTLCPFKQMYGYVESGKDVLRSITYSSEMYGLVVGGTYYYNDPNPPHQQLEGVNTLESLDSGRDWLSPIAFIAPPYLPGANEFTAAEAVGKLFIVVGDNSYVGYFRGPNNSIHSKGNKVFLGLHFFDTNRGFVVGTSGSIIYTANGGKVWSTIPSPDSSKLMKITFTDSTHGWIVGTNGLILHTNNGGWIGGTSEVKQTPVAISTSSLSYSIGEKEWILRTKDDFNEIPKVSVFSVLGVKVLENITCEKISDGEYGLKTNLPNGFYFAKFQTGNKVIVLPLIQR